MVDQTSEDSENKEEESNCDLQDIDDLGGELKTRSTEFDESFIRQRSRDKIAESQESTRSNLAITVMIIYGLTLLLSFAVIGYGLDKDQRKEVLTLILTSQSTIIGGAVGFYFGNRSSN